MVENWEACFHCQGSFVGLGPGRFGLGWVGGFGLGEAEIVQFWSQTRLHRIS